MAFQIAVPSYKRANVLCERTLKLLASLSIPFQNISVFIIDDEDEICSYKRHLHTANFDDVNLICAHIDPGLHRMRNYITQYYAEDTWILNMDDDIESIQYLHIDTTIDDVNKCQRYKLLPFDATSFMPWVQHAFADMESHGLRLFGVYPVKNGFFMKDLPAQTYDLRFCVGAFWGCINTKSLCLTLEEKEDFERTLLFWEAYHGVLRFNNVTVATKYYKTEGGMQARGNNAWRQAEAERSCDILCKRYPNVCRLYTGKKNGIMEVRLLNPKH
jgi:hypothetical protein